MPRPSTPDPSSHSSSSQSPHGRRRRAVRLLLAAGYVAFVLAATLLPASVGSGASGASEPNPLCLLCGARGLADAFLNLLFFLPLGFLLARPLGPRWTVALAAALSLVVEASQLRVPGRFSTAGDFVFNTVGAAAGVALAVSWRVWVFPSPPLRRRLVVAWTVGLAALLVGAGWAFGPSVTDRPLYGQWTAAFGDLEVYDGRILGAWIGDRFAPSTRLERSDEAARALERGDPVRVRFVAGPPPPGLAPIFSVYDDRRERIFLLGADRDDLVLTLRRRADDARLDRPEVRLTGGLRGVEAGDTVELTVERPTAATYRIEFAEPPSKAGGRGPTAEEPSPGPAAVEGGYTLGRSWALLLFSGVWPAWFGRTVDWIWLALLAAPLAWWAPDARWLAGGGAVYIASLAGVPPWFGLLATPPVEYAAAFGGLCICYGARHIFATD